MNYPLKFFPIKTSALAVKTVLLTASIFSSQSWADEANVIEQAKLKSIEVIPNPNNMMFAVVNFNGGGDNR
jgi:hypothetical protein